jgi:hypothetical protein
MKRKTLVKTLITTLSIFMFANFAKAQNCDQLTAAQLKEKLIQLGNEVRDINTTSGSEKYEVKYTTATLDVPVAYELSGSKNWVWLTVFLGTPRADTSVINAALLKQNFIIQPCQFYITAKGNLMMGMAIENRGLTNAIIKKHSDKIVADVVSTASFWQK